MVTFLSEYVNDTYKTKLNIIFVYISEAHATDIWPIGMSAGTLNSSHKIIGDRIRCAKKMIDTYGFIIPTYVDTMTNNYRDTYSAWPFRAYGFKNGKIVYKSGIKNSEYDPIELCDAITDMIKT